MKRLLPLLLLVAIIIGCGESLYEKDLKRQNTYTVEVLYYNNIRDTLTFKSIYEPALTKTSRESFGMLRIAEAGFSGYTTKATGVLRFKILNQ